LEIRVVYECQLASELEEGRAFAAGQNARAAYNMAHGREPWQPIPPDADLTPYLPAPSLGETGNGEEPA
jgi:hypothetical protein